MPVAKRPRATTARKTGAKKRKAKVGKAATSPATISLFGRRYTKSLCSLTKADATKKAEAHRAKGKGKGAAVKKNAGGTGYCLYKRG